MGTLAIVSSLVGAGGGIPADPVYKVSIYQASKAVTTTEQFENIATDVNAFRIDNSTAGTVTLTVDGVSIGTVASATLGVLTGSGTELGYVGTGSGTADIGQGKL